MRRVVNPITLWLGGPTLTVRGRRTGRPIRTPVPTLDVGGTRYLVSGGGETHWVRNLRQHLATHVAFREGIEHRLDPPNAIGLIQAHQRSGCDVRAGAEKQQSGGSVISTPVAVRDEEACAMPGRGHLPVLDVGAIRDPDDSKPPLQTEHEKRPVVRELGAIRTRRQT